MILPRCLVALILLPASTAFAQPTAQTAEHAPARSHRPPSPPQTEGKMKIDVVTDAAGQPVAGLTQKDFTLLDNKKSRPILSFSAVDGTTGDGTRNDPPVEVILVVDVTNTLAEVVGWERDQIEPFLRRNGGRLSQPTSVMIFDNQGVKGLPQPTRDGNQLADVLRAAQATTHLVPQTTQTEPDRMTMSLNAVERITEAANTKAGRTKLIWAGDGWPMLEEPRYQFSTQDYAGLFDRVVTISGEMHQARVTLYSFYPADPAVPDSARFQHYRSFLKAASSVNQVRPGNLALPVLAIHSGGRALDAPGDLGDEIASCIAEVKVYYTLKARTTAGYYGEPAFQFQLPTLSTSQ